MRPVLMFCEKVVCVSLFLYMFCADSRSGIFIFDGLPVEFLLIIFVFQGGDKIEF